MADNLFSVRDSDIYIYIICIYVIYIYIYTHKFLISTVHTQLAMPSCEEIRGLPSFDSNWERQAMPSETHSTLAQRLTEKDHKHITIIPNFQGDFEKTFPNLEKSYPPNHPNPNLKRVETF